VRLARNHEKPDLPQAGNALFPFLLLLFLRDLHFYNFSGNTAGYCV